MNHDFENLSSKEFLLTNGIGGYCASSISGANTRRYHGLLVASFNPPTQRLVMVSKVQDTIVNLNGETFELSSNQYPNTIAPTGFQYLKKHNATVDCVQFSYSNDDWQIEKNIFVKQGENTTILNYTNTGEDLFTLNINSLLVYRDYHALFTQHDEFNFFVEKIDDLQIKVYAKYGANPVFIKINYGNWELQNSWYKSFEYRQEKERGFDYAEDAMSLGKIIVDLKPTETFQLIFSTEQIDADKVCKIPAIKKAENNKEDQFINDLIKSSKQFLVQRKSTNGSTIIAGYHWFADWGRDTMIALRGISIATGKKAEAKSILQTFFDVLSEGMLPNRFPDYENDEVEYNTIDATLWLFIALYEYYEKFEDKTFIKKVLPQLKDIIDWHIKGTRFNIHVTEHGLLYGGEIGYQLTWMDAKIGDLVVTPRIGCPVEINALWYNALNIYSYFLAEITNKKDESITELSSKCEASFIKYFLNDKGYLNDVVIPTVYTDDSLRPNQIYAVSLPFSPLSTKQQQQVLKCVEEALLTPYGLRTLNIDDPNFRPTYKGDAFQRDTAYHQGTVWPFLWGEWAMAFLKINKLSKKAVAKVLEHAQPLQEHFYNEGCSFAIAEIFDGLEPNVGKGCVQQAWSIGNMLQVLLLIKNKDNN